MMPAINERLLEEAHARLLAGSANAPSELFELCAPHLRSIVRRSVPQLVDPAEVDTAVVDAMLDYFKEPGAFNPSRSALLTWLANKARYNALTLARGQQKWQGRQRAIVEAAGEGVYSADGSSGGEDSAVDAITAAEVLSRHGADLAPNPGDADVFLLMVAGVREDDAYVAALGLDGSPTARLDVRRRKQAMRQRISRLRERLKDGGWA